MKAVTMFTMILESSSCSDQLQCNIQRHLFSQIVKKYIQKLGRYIVLYKLNRRKVAMQRQLIVQAPQRDGQRQINDLDNQVRTRDRSLSFADDNQIDGHHLAFAHYINAGNNETEAQNNQIYVVNGQYSEQIQLNQSYNIENNQFSYDQQNDTPPMPMYMNDISGYLQNGNESMQLQHKAHQQQEQYWSKYFRKDEDSDDSLSDEEDNKISEKKVEEIFGKEEEQKMEENIITFKKILNEEEFNGNMVESRLKKLFQLILPSPFHNSPRNMMQFGRMLRKQSFQKLNRNYRTIIKKPTQDGFKQMGQRQIKVTFNNEVSLKFFRREEQVWTLQGASQIVEQINQIEKRSRITPSMLMQQWQQYQRQPLHSKFTISNTVQQWILPSRSALIWDGMNKHNNRFYIEQGRVSGQSQLEYSNSFRTVDLKIIPIHNNHQVFADVNDSV